MPAKRSSFRIIPHTAEVALELRGSDWPSFFASAARGLMALYAVEPALPPSETKRLEMRADSAEELLVAWLNELIYWTGTKRWIAVEARVSEAYPTQLSAELSGAPLPPGARLAREIKAATFGGLTIGGSDAKGWKATVILDV
ncbi:MAG: archease [Elusimicrobia bacterium]|nr:archease [Elusimicrobiota bacterium]